MQYQHNCAKWLWWWEGGDSIRRGKPCVNKTLKSWPILLLTAEICDDVITGIVWWWWRWRWRRRGGWGVYGVDYSLKAAQMLYLEVSPLIRGIWAYKTMKYSRLKTWVLNITITSTKTITFTAKIITLAKNNIDKMGLGLATYMLQKIMIKAT